MEVIVKVWFEEKRVWILTDKGKRYSRPLQAFPRLYEATPDQRNKFVIGMFGDDIRWEEVDEDIHISSFFNKEEVDLNNPIGLIFKRFPQLNVSEIARDMGINKSLLARYIYGIKKPSQTRQELIINHIRNLGKEMSQI